MTAASALKLVQVYAAIALLSGCTSTQEPAWGKNTLYSKEEIAKKEQDSRQYLNRVWETIMQAKHISVKDTDSNGKALRNRRLNRHEQETLRVLVCYMKAAKLDTTAHPALPAKRTLLVCTDARGKRTQIDTANICPLSQISKDGYGRTAQLALRDADYATLQRVLHPQNFTTPQPDHATAKAHNTQAAEQLRRQLKTCKSIEIEFIGNITDTYYNRKLSATEMRQLLSILRTVKPLPFKGTCISMPEDTRLIHFCDASGKRQSTLNVETLTDAASARKPALCTEAETMFISTTHYNQMRQLWQILPPS